jgi:hypothetical protein
MAISLAPFSEIIHITTPTDTTTIQELVNTIREWEAELHNLSYDKVIDAEGKSDVGSSVFTAITMKLSSAWQIQFWSGVTFGTVEGGNLVGGVGDKPIKATGGPDTILVINQVGGTIAVTGSGVTDQDKLDIADAVWDEDITTHAVLDSTADYVTKILEDTGTTVPGLIAALNDLSNADINAQVADVLKVDTITEMSQGVPPTPPTMEQVLNYLYVMMRNKNEQTSSEHSVYDDAGTTKLFKATTSDDGTTFTKEEYESG